MSPVLDELMARLNYIGYVGLTLIGFYAMITRAHLMRQVVGLVIFQTGIIVFFISTAAKWGGALPIAVGEGTPAPVEHMNPLPHALMLTAIVVSVAVQGVALALLIRLKRTYGTLDEDELVQQMD
ncbi:MAG: sodium:proton antiporter [Myxococcota bacterium]